MQSDSPAEYLLHDDAEVFAEIRVVALSEGLAAELGIDSAALGGGQVYLRSLFRGDAESRALLLLDFLGRQAEVEGSILFHGPRGEPLHLRAKIRRVIGAAGGQVVWQLGPERTSAEGVSDRSPGSELFAGLAHRLSDVSTPRDAAVAILEVADRLFGWDACNLNLYESGSERTHTIISYDEVDGERREFGMSTFYLPLSPMTLRVLREGRKLLLFNDEIRDPERELRAYGNMGRRSRSLMFVPVRKGEKNIGVLTIQSYRPGAYTQHDLDLLQILADYCSGALERTLAEKRLGEQAALTEKFAQLGEQLSAVTTTRDAAHIILMRSREVFGWDAAFFYLCTPPSHYISDGLTYDTVDGECREVEPLHRDSPPTPLIRRCLDNGLELHRRMTASDDLAAASQKFGNVNRLSAELIFAPIRYQGEAIGVISIQSYESGTYFEENLPAVQALADHCGGALARIFAEAELRSSMERLQLVTAQMPAIIWTVDRRLRLALLAGGGMRKFGWDERKLLGMRLQDFLAADVDRDLVVRSHRQALRGHADSYELVWNENVFECHLEPLRDAKGEVIGCLNIAHDITSRKRAEIELRKFQRAIEETPNGIVITNAEHLIEYVNPAFTRLTQFALPDLLGLPVQLLEPLDEERSPELAELLRGSNRFYEGVTLRHKKNGDTFYGIEIEEPIDDSSGAITHYVRVCLDVTEQVEAARELRRAHDELERRVEERTAELLASNERLLNEVRERRAAEERAENALSLQRATLESTFDAIAAVDMEGRLVVWNSRWPEMWGLDTKRIRARQMNFYDHLMSCIADSEKLAARVQEIRKETDAEIFEVLNHRDGRVFESYSKPQILAGEILGRVWSFRDVTQRSHAEQALAKSEAVYREAIERAAGVPYRMIYGKEGYDFIGVGVEKLLGIPASEVTKKRIAELKLDIEILDRGISDFDAYAEMVQSGKVDQYRVDLHLRVGNEDRWVNDCSVPLRDERTGEVIGTLGILQDITARKRFEREFRIQQERLVRTEKLVALGTLVSGVAHEINNPNNFIMLNAPLLAEMWESLRPILDEYRREHGDFLLAGIDYNEVRDEVPMLIAGIIHGAKRIENIVSELRDFALPKEDSFREDVNLNQVVQSALVLLKSVIQKSTKCFVVEYAENLPPIRGNFQRLEQVVINLVQNACQALTSDGQFVRVATSFQATGKQVCLEVKDGGRGIEPERLNQISDPFFTTKRETGGIGLGLSITSNIVNEHEGTIEFTSRVGVGTQARIHLPVARRAELGAPLQPSTHL